MSSPSRDTISGRVYLDLRALARQQGRPTDELFVRYVLERFLYRLSISTYRSRLVLKGGMLLAALDQRRPTRDVDLLATATANDIDTIAGVIREVATVQADDGVVFDLARMATQPIREQDVYAGARIVVPARVDRAQHPLRVDVNVGDPVTPAPVEIEYPALLGKPFRLVGYPIETVLAEKLVTMIDRGDTTTRERDFADVVVLIGRHTIDAARLLAAISATAVHRGTALRPLADVLVRLGGERQAAWERFLARAGLNRDLPTSYQEAIRRIAEFADPVLTGSKVSGRWDHARSRWET